MSLWSLLANINSDQATEELQNMVEGAVKQITHAHHLALRLVLAAVKGVLEGPEGDWRPAGGPVCASLSRLPARPP